MTYKQSPKEPIAIIGSGCRFPGNATSSHKLWDLLCQPRDLTKEVPHSRFNAQGFYHPEGEHHGASNVTKAHFLEQDPRLFDSGFFSIAPREAEAIDPQQRVVLETVYEAMENAGLSLSSLKGSPTACYVGVMTGDYAEAVTRDPETFSQYMATGTSRALVSNRVSYVFDLAGPSMTIDTACSSSLVAVHLAVQSLRSGESTMACAAGSNLLLNPDSFIGETSLHMISTDGQSKMWDISANGYARGEGVAAVFLKTLSRAIADGDRIDAIIRETGVNQDGRTQGITLPSPEAQAALIRSTYRSSGLNVEDPLDACQYFEAHGTGTQAGDPREASAIKSAFFPPHADEDSNRKLFVGSIKTVIGHTEGCAGVAGLLKAALALKHRLIPPNQHFKTLNPKIADSYKNLCVPTKLTPWPEVGAGDVPRASVNSFGFGGTNAHAIVEAYVPEVHNAASQAASLPRPFASLGRDFTPMPLFFSANSASALLSMVHRYSEYLEKSSTPLHEVAATLRDRRSLLPFKISFVGPTRAMVLEEMKSALFKAEGTKELGRRITPVGNQKRILGVFTGQGAQWPTMARSLLQKSPRFRRSIEYLEDALSSLPDGPSWKLSEELAAEKSLSRVREAAISQPACTAIQIALVDVMSEAGISFTTVIGHSSGEIAAAYAAGFISAKDAVRIAYYRGFHAKLASGRQGEKGAMIAVGMSHQQAIEFCKSSPQLKDKISVAASNSPESVTLSGDESAVKSAKAELDQRGLFNRMLQVDTAYHSHHMEPCAGAYLDSLKACGIQVQAPSKRTTWISSVSGGSKVDFKSMAAAVAGPYWRDNMVQTVLFSQAVEGALEHTNGEFDFAVEIGPHPALKGPVLQTMKARLGSDVPYEGVLNRTKDDVAAFSSALGSLSTMVAPDAVDFAKYSLAFTDEDSFDSRLVPVADLPTYAWDQKLLWRESRLNKQLRLRREKPHEILGARTTDDSEHEPRWRNIIKLEELPWLRDHKIQGQTIVPGAFYCIMAFEAAASIARARGEPVHMIELKNLEIIKAILMDEASEGSETLFSVRISDTSAPGTLVADFSLSAASIEDGTMRRICTGQMRISTGLAAHTNDHNEHVEELIPMNIDRFYAALGDLGLGYTGSFRALSSLERGFNRASATIAASESNHWFPMAPASLDICFQTVFAAFAATNDDSLWTAFLPTKIGSLKLILPSLGQEVAHAESLDVLVDAFISSFEPASHNAMPKLTADLEVSYGNDLGGHIKIQDLVMSAFTPTSASDDRQVYQRTVWKQDIMHGIACSGAENLGTPEEGEEYAMNSYEQAARRYIDAWRAAVPDTDKDAKYSDLIATAKSTPSVPVNYSQKQGDGAESIDLLLIRAVGETLLDSTTVVSQRPRQRKSRKPHESPEVLYPEWRASHADLARVEQHLLDATKQIAHRYPRMRILELGAVSDRLAGRFVAELGRQFLTYTISSEELVSSQATIDKRVHILQPGTSPDEALGTETLDLILLTDPLKAGSMLSEARKLLRPGGFLLLVTPAGTTSRWALLRSFFKTETSDRGALSTVHLHKRLRETGFSGILSSSPRSSAYGEQGCSLIVSQADNAAVSLFRQPLVPTAASSLFQGRLVIVGGSTLRTLQLADNVASRLQSVWQGPIETVESLPLHPKKLRESVAILNLTELDRPVFRFLHEDSYANLKSTLQCGKKMLWLTEKATSFGPFHNALVGLARTVIAEDPSAVIQVLDLDTFEGSEAVIAETLLRLIAADHPTTKAGAVVSPLWTTELELAVEQGKLLIPRVVMDQSRNDDINSARRVIESEVCLTDVAISIGTSDSGECVAHLVDLNEASTDSAIAIEVSVEFSCSQPLLIDGAHTPLYLCIGVAQDSKRVLAASPNQGSRLRVSQDNFVPLDQFSIKDSPGAMQRFLHDYHHYLMARAVAASIPPESSVLLVEPAKMLSKFMSILTRGKETEIHSIHFGNPARPTHRSSEKKIMVRPGLSRRELTTLLPTDTRLAIFFGDETKRANEDLELLQSCLPKTCTQITQRKLSTSSQTLFSNHEDFSALASSITLADAYNGDTPVVTVSDLIATGRPSDASANVIIDWTGDQRLMVPAKPLRSTALFSGSKTYLLVGLTGQMGQSICKWMVANGARHIVVTSRNPSSGGYWLEALRQSGADVRIKAADVTRHDDVSRLRDDIARDMPPVAGIMNGAMVLADGLFADMSYENMRRVLRPKMDGSIILDNVFAEYSLDFFIMLSSVNAATGMAGQANYVAANMFMVGLAADRRRRGLVASVVDIGMVIGIGIIQRTEGDAGTGVVERNLRKQNLAAISERDLHHMLGEAILAGPQEADVEIITGLQYYHTSSPNKPLWHKNPRFSHLVIEDDRENEDQAQGLGSGRKSVANASSSEEACTWLQEALVEFLASELKLPPSEVSIDTPIIDFGVDSLVAAGIRNWFMSEHQAEVPVLKILGGSSIQQVCQEAVLKLYQGSTKEEDQKEDDSKTAQRAGGPPTLNQILSAIPLETRPIHDSSGSSRGDSIPGDTGYETSLVAPSEEGKDSRSAIIQRESEQSLGQSRLFFSSSYLEDATPFNCTTSYTLSGPLDVPRLAQALDMIIERHDVFRTRFYTDEQTGEAKQAVMDRSNFQLKLLEQRSESDYADEFRNIHSYCFDLENGDTFIATLLKQSNQKHILVFGYHHIIIDGVSWQLFLQDLGRFYREPSSMANLQDPGQCIDFAKKQSQDIRTGAYKDRLQFWQSVFPEAPSPLPLFPFSKVAARRSLSRYSMHEVMVPIDVGLVSAIKRASVGSRTTPFHFWLSSFQVLLHRMLDTDNVCIGIIDANRSDTAFSQVIGFLLEIMPLQFRLQGTQKFGDVLKETRTKTYGALANSGVPMEELARACGVQSDKVQVPFCQIIFNYRMGATMAPDMGNSQMEFLDYSDAKVPFDMAISVDEKEDGTGLLTISAQDYLYDMDAINLLVATYKMLLTQFSSDTSTLIGQVSLYEPSLVQKALTLGSARQLNGTPETDTLFRRFHAWSLQDPGAVAVKDMAGRSMTYGEASKRADQIAAALLSRSGVRPGARIAVLCEPTGDTVATILAIHKVGAAYVPLDTYADDQRLLDILEQSEASVLVHQSSTAARALGLTRRSGTTLSLDLASVDESTSSQSVKDQSSAGDVAYVLYTSGSTGKPKGIALTHANFCTHITACTQELDLGRETVLQQSGQGFDAAAWELFVALCNGGTVILSDNHLHPAEIAETMRRERVTATLLIISEAHALLQYGESILRECNNWRVTICGGENFSPSLIDKFIGLGLPDLRVYNGYGPTETSIMATIGRAALRDAAERGDDYKVPIGPPLPGYSIYLVDEDFKPVPRGWVGEVVIHGHGVVQSGYLGNPDLSRAKWKPALALVDGEESLCYLTGDRGKMLPDGSLLILGRIDGDSMVKIRGFRVNVDEVADFIVERSHGVLQDARVVVRRTETTGEAFLVAFVVFSKHVDNEHEYLSLLLQGLPLATQMRPTLAVPLQALPFTERGKLDHKALANLDLPKLTDDDQGEDQALSEDEAKLKAIWQDVIHDSGGTGVRIQKSSDFFAVGGNSLLLLRLKAEIVRAFDVDLSLPELFRSSTLEGLALRIQGSSNAIDSQVFDWDIETKPAELSRDLLDQLHGLRTIRPPSTGLVVVLTGSTGFLGAALLRALVANPAVQSVHCVAVRNPNRLPADLDLAKVVVHTGDLAEPLLGLASYDVAAQIFSKAHSVIHNGAEVSHMKNYGSLRLANVESTRELMRLILTQCDPSRGIPSFHYVSTAGVSLLTGWDELPEAQLPPHAIPATDGVHGYITSKWASERLVERVVQQVPSLRAFVHRPSNITGEGVDSQDIVNSVLRFSKALKAVPDLGPDFGSFDLIHVDTAANGILQDVLGASEDEMITYRHQSGETIVPAENLKQYLGQSESEQYRVLSMEAWIAEARETGLDELVVNFLQASTGGMKMPLLLKDSNRL